MDDPKWKADFTKYSGKIDNSKNEFRKPVSVTMAFCNIVQRGREIGAMGEENTFVTCGQKPDWLNADHPNWHW
jgi:hypothetical protein